MPPQISFEGLETEPLKFDDLETEKKETGPIDPSKLKTGSSGKDNSLFGKVTDAVKSVFNEPHINRALVGFNAENSPGLFNKNSPGGQTSFPEDWLNIPGVNEAANYLANKINPQGSEGGWLPWLGAGAIREGGAILAGGLDPRAAVPMKGAAIPEVLDAVNATRGTRLAEGAEAAARKNQKQIPAVTGRKFILNSTGQAMETPHPTTMVDEVLAREHELRPEIKGDIPLDWSEIETQKGSRFEPTTEIEPPKIERDRFTGKPIIKPPYVGGKDPTRQTNIFEQPSAFKDFEPRRESAFSERMASYPNENTTPRQDITPRFTKGANETYVNQFGRKVTSVDRDILTKRVEQMNMSPEEKAALLKSATDGKANPGYWQKAVDFSINGLKEANIFSKSVLSSADISPPFRQGKALWYSRDWWNSWDDMFKAWGSKNAYEGIMDGIKTDPMYQSAVDNGLSFTGSMDKLNKFEEGFGSKIAEHVPLVSRSERAYSAFLNKLRFDHYKRLMNSADAAGILTPKVEKDIVGFINNATGRGDLGILNKYGDALNHIFFSPRFLKSRLSYINPRNYVSEAYGGNTSGFVAKQKWKSAAALVSAAVAMNKLYGLATGATTDYSDPTSADFAKAKYGNVRMDPGAGMQQPIVLVARLMSGLFDMYGRGNVGDYGRYKQTTPWDQASSFAQNKLAPIPSFVAGMMRGTDFDLQPFEIQKGFVNRVTPIMAQDLYSIIQERDPELLKLIPFAIAGESLQNYSR